MSGHSVLQLSVQLTSQGMNVMDFLLQTSNKYSDTCNRNIIFIVTVVPHDCG